MGVPPFVLQIIGVVVRVIVVWFAGVLFERAGLKLTDEQIGQVIAYLTPVVAVAAYAIWRNFRGRQKLLVGLAAPYSLSEREAEAILRDPAMPNPSVNTPKSDIPR